MMRKSLVTTIAVLATTMLLSVATAKATVYKFTLQSSDAELMASGEFAVDAAGQVTGASGVIFGLVNQTISAVSPNPNFSSLAYSLTVS
jgi:hypothetical protein